MSNRVQFRLNKENDHDIEEALKGHDNRTERVKQLLRNGIKYEMRANAMDRGNIYIEAGSSVRELSTAQQTFIQMTKQMKKQTT